MNFIVIGGGPFVRQPLITSLHRNSSMTPNVNYKQNTPENPLVKDKDRRKAELLGHNNQGTLAWERKPYHPPHLNIPSAIKGLKPDHSKYFSWVQNVSIHQLCTAPSVSLSENKWSSDWKIWPRVNFTTFYNISGIFCCQLPKNAGVHCRKIATINSWS